MSKFSRLLVPAHLAGLSLLAVTLAPSALAASRDKEAALIPLAQNVTTTLNINDATITQYTVETLTATVALGMTPVTSGGIVNFYDANSVPKLIGTAPINSIGKATLKVVPGVGTHTYTAKFQGNATTGPTAVSNTAAVTVSNNTTASTKYVSQGFLSSTNSGTAGSYNLSDLMVFVGNNTPTGNVTFTDSTAHNTLDTVTVAASTKSFAEGVAPTTRSQVLTATVGDFNGDGYPDIAYTNEANNTISIALNSSSSTHAALTSAIFAAPVSYPTGSEPLTLTTGDFNGDGHLDLAVANVGDNTVSILLGNGSSFTPTSSPVSVGTSPFSLASGDFNNDGKLDLAVANLVDNTVSILIGNGQGGFTPASTATLTTGSVPIAVAVADLDGDLNPDLIVANANESDAYVFFGNGDGTFQPKVILQTGQFPATIATGDFDNDGLIDIAVLNQDTPGSVSVFHNNQASSQRTFTKPNADYAVGSYPYGLVAGDLFGNGKMDLATSNYSDNSFTVLGNDGTGNFTPRTFSDPSNYNGVTGLAGADFNGDGRMDLVIPNYNTNTANILLGTIAYNVLDSNQAISGTGTHSILANYNVGTNDPYTTSTQSPISLAAFIASSITETVSTSSHISSGQSETFSATITKVGTPRPTGTVTFTDDSTGTTLCTTSALSTNGKASCTTQAITGAHNSKHMITATYSGDGSYAAITDSDFTTFTIN